jgi:hypothetical protein
MIYLAFNLTWPFLADKPEYYKEYFYKSWKVSKHKSVEIQCDRGGKTIFGFSFSFTTRCDHGGLMVDLTLLRRQIIFTFNDNRHWNENNGRYLNYGDPEEIKEYYG